MSRDKRALEIARRAANAAQEKQASDIFLLDLSGTCPFADFFLICTGDNKRHMEAIREEIERALLEEGVRLLRDEGEGDSGWILMDFGDLIVHIFSPEQRSFYRLEELWSNASPVLRIL